MGLVAAGRNAAVGGVTSVAAYVSLHSADPSTTGANELTGGSPAYARQAVTWGSASNGAQSLGGAEQFDVPAGSTVAYFGLWSAATTGTFYGSGALSATETYGGQGTYTLNNATVTIT